MPVGGGRAEMNVSENKISKHTGLFLRRKKLLSFWQHSNVVTLPWCPAKTKKSKQ